MYRTLVETKEQTARDGTREGDGISWHDDAKKGEKAFKRNANEPTVCHAYLLTP